MTGHFDSSDGHFNGHLSIESVLYYTSCSGSCLHWYTGHIVVYHVCSGGHLTGHCACASPGEILYILPELATMSVLCSWHVHCLGCVIWWSDRNKQGLLTEFLSKYVFL